MDIVRCAESADHLKFLLRFILTEIDLCPKRWSLCAKYDTCMRNILALTTLLLVSCGKSPTQDHAAGARVNSYEVERIFDNELSLNFDHLPLQGSASGQSEFWSGHPWASRRGSINQRWNAPGTPGQGLPSPSAREARAMPASLLRELSPAEKYDLYQGRYDYPLKHEVEALVAGAKYDWEGVCHGWAAASSHHSEPKPVKVKNPDGLEIPFGSADVKALLSYAYSKILIRETDSTGKRCERENFLAEDECDSDLSPETFHAVLGNYLGLRGESVIADIDRWKEVWNHPLISYQTKIIWMIGLREGGRRGLMKTSLVYVDTVEKNSWDSGPTIHGNLTVSYELDLDPSGNITGGRWRSLERPDFLWRIQRADSFDGYLKDVELLLK